MSANRAWVAATLGLVGLGLLFAEPTLLGAALVPLAFLGYATLSGQPGTVQLQVARTLSKPTAAPGETVTVRLTVENDGDRTLTDLRVLDGYPDLTVTEGAPRAATALAPGESTTVEYDLLTRRGVFEFGPALVRVRSLSGTAHRTVTADVSGPDQLVGRPAGASVTPSSADGVREVGGGVEFHATREYRRGDPLGRIDWRHVAKTGEFVTVQYREPRTARTALVVDAREPVRGRLEPGRPSLAALSVDAAESLADGLGHRLCGVGVAGLDAAVADDGVVWLDSRSSRVESLLGTVRTRVGGAAPDPEHEDVTTATGSTPRTRPSADGGYREPATNSMSGGGHGGSDERSESGDGREGSDGSSGSGDGRGGPEGLSEGGGVSSAPAEPDAVDGVAVGLLASVPDGARVVLCTPALDGWPDTFARLAREHGHDVTVLSPRIDASTVAGRLAERRRRGALERLGEQVQTVEYEPGRPVVLDGGNS
jgi:uncharacterized repeat protein (TIGR01451 family)